MRDSIQVLWANCHSIAVELEVFEPAIAGLGEQLVRLQSGQQICQSWLSVAEPYLRDDNLSSIALILNEIAGIYYNKQELVMAKAVGDAALTLHKSVFGIEHENTKLIEQNLACLNRERQEPARDLPKVRNFNKRGS